MNIKQKWFDPALFSIKTEKGTITLVSLFIPMLLEHVMLNMLGTVNTALLSDISEDAVAAVGAANQVLSMFSLVLNVIVSGAAAIVNNYLGAGKKKETAETAMVTVLLCSGLALLLGVLMAMGSPFLMSLMNLENEVNDYAVNYFRIRSAFWVISAVTMSLNILMRCYGIAKTAVYSGLVSNAVNLLGTLCVVRLLNSDVYQMVTAVSFACVVGMVGGLVVSVYNFRKQRIPLKMATSGKVFVNLILKMLKIGIPTGVATMGFTLSQVLSTSYVALLGAMVLSGKVYFTTITSYCYLFSFTMGNASAVLVGRYCGAGEHEKADKMCKQLCRITSALNLAVSVLLLIFYRPILGCFTKQEEIVAVAFIVFVIDLVMQQARAISHVYERTLVVTGDNLFSTICIIVSGMINGVGLGYFLSVHLGLGLPGLWCAFAVDEIVRAIATAGRWRTGKWRVKSGQILQ